MTEFKDDDGKEVYEGDILYVGVFTCFVVFEKGSFVLYDAENKQEFYYGEKVYEKLDLLSKKLDYDHQCTVVGNIHDNPEMLIEL